MELVVGMVNEKLEEDLLLQGAIDDILLKALEITEFVLITTILVLAIPMVLPKTAMLNTIEILK